MNEEPGKETRYKVASFSDKMRAEREWKEGGQERRGECRIALQCEGCRGAFISKTQ